MDKYTMVRNEFLERSDLTPTEKLIMVYLTGRMRPDGKPWDVNREQIAKALSIGVSSVQSALAALKAKGWLTDNRARVRGDDGRTRRPPSHIVESRRHDVVMPPKKDSLFGNDSQGGLSQSFRRSHQRVKTNVGNHSSNEGQSHKGLSLDPDSAPKRADDGSSRKDKIIRDSPLVHSHSSADRSESDPKPVSVPLSTTTASGALESARADGSAERKEARRQAEDYLAKERTYESTGSPWRSAFAEDV